MQLVTVNHAKQESETKQRKQLKAYVIYDVTTLNQQRSCYATSD